MRPPVESVMPTGRKGLRWRSSQAGSPKKMGKNGLPRCEKRCSRRVTKEMRTQIELMATTWSSVRVAIRLVQRGLKRRSSQAEFPKKMGKNGLPRCEKRCSRRVTKEMRTQIELMATTWSSVRVAIRLVQRGLKRRSSQAEFPKKMGKNGLPRCGCKCSLHAARAMLNQIELWKASSTIKTWRLSSVVTWEPPRRSNGRLKQARYQNKKQKRR